MNYRKTKDHCDAHILRQDKQHKTTDKQLVYELSDDLRYEIMLEEHEPEIIQAKSKN